MKHLTINAERLWKTIMDTALIGASGDGGINRLTLGEDDRRIRDWLRDECARLGCTVTVDQVGNIFAYRPGQNAGALPIAIGSHLDTQRTGGKFDGILGVLAGLEVLKVLNDQEHVTHAPLMLVNWTNEEGARFAPAMLGSGVHAGIFNQAFAESRTDPDGISFAAALQAIGYRGEVPVGATRLGAMFELHIEQGPVLEQTGTQIGIVTGVQGMRWYDVKITGTAAHAGTTPMAMRCDALADAAQIILAAQDIARCHGGLATTGVLSVGAPSHNVVPGAVEFSLDLRHVTDASLELIQAEVLAFISTQCADRAQVDRIWDSPAVAFDADCLASVRAGADATGAAACDIVSGAGHDAVQVSRVTPTAMIFVPCKDGLSHNPAESATRDDCAMGAQVLLNAVLDHDARLSGRGI